MNNSACSQIFMRKVNISLLRHRIALSGGGRHGQDELAGADRAAPALGVAGRTLDLDHGSTLLKRLISAHW